MHDPRTKAWQPVAVVSRRGLVKINMKKLRQKGSNSPLKQHPHYGQAILVSLVCIPVVGGTIVVAHSISTWTNEIGNRHRPFPGARGLARAPPGLHQDFRSEYSNLMSPTPKVGTGVIPRISNLNRWFPSSSTIACAPTVQKTEKRP